MSSIGTGYDLTASQFSPDGRVFQVEYAIKAAENSGTAIGLRGRDGVVLAVERLVFSKLYEPRAQSNSRIFNLDKHIGMAIGGLLADARAMADYAREECSNFRSNFGIPIPLHHLSDRLSAYMHAYTLLGSIRPFGCSLIVASYEALPQSKQPVPQLFMIDPSGLSNGYIGCAVGKSRQFAKTEIEKLKVQNLSCNELVNEAARIIYGAHEEAETREKPFELELSWVSEATGGRHELVPPAVLSAANDYAKTRLREAVEGEDEEMSAAQ